MAVLQIYLCLKRYDGNDRKRLKSIISELDIAKGRAVIVRSAGAERSKAEVKRDYEYLLKLWNDIRDLTMQSAAPFLIHEETNIIKRAFITIFFVFLFKFIYI